MELNIVHEVATLERMTIGQLRQRFAELFGEATAASNRTWLVKRIAWRLQALAEGDLSERARRRAAELARDADLRLNSPRSQTTTVTPPEPVSVPAPIDPRLPPPGTILDGGSYRAIFTEPSGHAPAAEQDYRFRPYSRPALPAGEVR